MLSSEKHQREMFRRVSYVCDVWRSLEAPKFFKFFSSDASLSKLLTELYPRVERVLLVVEADDSYVGREIILDLSGSSRASAWRVRSKPTDGNLFTELCSEYYLCNNEEWTTNLATVYELVREKHSARHFLR